MDVVLGLADKYFFSPYIYPSSIPEDNVWRQLVSLNILADGGGALLYIITASLSYMFIYDKRLLRHPLMLENQVLKEIKFTFRSIPLMGFLTSVAFLLEVRGYSRLYDSVSEARFGWLSIASSVVSFLLFTDCLIYWIHRGLHHRMVYKTLHKDHHQWKVPTPFASHAFHPVDGFLQSVPYHLYVFLFPLHKYVYLGLYIGVNIWTVSIHDGDFRVPKILEPIVNGSAHHTDHHLFYNYNYGQYLTLWDRLGGSFRSPSGLEGSGPLDTVKLLEQNHKMNECGLDAGSSKKGS